VKHSKIYLPARRTTAAIAGGLLATALTAGVAAAAPYSTYERSVSRDVPGDGGWAGRGASTVRPAALPATERIPELPPGFSISGIDVSSHDHARGKTIDWAAEAANGLDFAYVKATEGFTYVNPYYGSDYAAAKRAGIFTGAYAYGRPDLGDPIGQADHLVDTMQWTQDGLTLPPFLDMEWPYGGLKVPTCYGLTPEQMVTWMRSFLERVEERIGVTPIIYTNVNWWNPCTGKDSSFAAYGLDISSCKGSPPSVPGWGTNWTFWQYDIPDCGRGGTRDYDVFHGNRDQLAALAGRTREIGAGSLSGDRRADAVTKDGATVHAVVNSGYDGKTGKVAWQAAVPIADGWDDVAASALYTGDLNGDGRTDALSKDGDTIYGSINAGYDSATGKVDWRAKVPIASGWAQVADTALYAGDLDGDGRIDLMSKDGDLLYAHRNAGFNYATGEVVWSAKTQIASGWASADSTAVYTGDLDGDGRADLMSKEGDFLYAYHNDGYNHTTGEVAWGSKTPISSGWAGTFDAAVYLADLSGDGRADLVTKERNYLYAITNGGYDKDTGTVAWGERVRIGEGWAVVPPEAVKFG